jgi:putative peptidoglycan lipid II flippase
MSRAAAERDLTQITADLSQSLRLTGVVLVPIAAGMIVLGPHLTTLLFAHENTSPAAAHLTGSVLAAYGLALVPFAGYQIMLRVFYALGDTRTPALISTGVSAVTIAACLASAQLTHGPGLVIALAVCTAIAYTAGFAAALTVHALGPIPRAAWPGSLVTVLAATAVGAGLYALTARALRITEFSALTAVLRPHNT